MTRQPGQLFHGSAHLSSHCREVSGLVSDVLYHPPLALYIHTHTPIVFVSEELALVRDDIVDPSSDLYKSYFLDL